MFVALRAFHRYAVCDMLQSMQCPFLVFISRKRTLSCLGALVIGWNVLGVSNTQAADGMLSSVSFSKIPSDANMVVEAVDDSEEYIDLLETVTSAVNSAGYVTSNNGAYLLIFEVHDEIGAYPRDQRHILSLETRGGRAGGGQDSQARINVFDSNTGGLLGQVRRSKIIGQPSIYRINVSIENRASGRTLWQGWASAELHNTINTELIKRMVPKIVSTIGETVRQETFSLY